MTSSALRAVLDAQIACIEEGGGAAVGLKGAAPLIALAQDEKPADFHRLAQTTLCTPLAKAGRGEASNLQCAREIAAFLALLRAMDARRADQDLLDRLIDVLSSAPDVSSLAFAEALRLTISQDRAERDRKAEELAHKRQQEAERVQRFVARFRTAPAHRIGLEDVLEEMRAMKSALTSQCWRAIAEEVAGGAPRTQDEAEAALKNWIDLNARWAESRDAPPRKLGA